MIAAIQGRHGDDADWSDDVGWSFADEEATVDVVDYAGKVDSRGDDVVGAEGEEFSGGGGDELVADFVGEILEGLLGEADFVAGVDYRDGPAAGGFGFFNVDGGVADFDKGVEGVEAHMFGGMMDHPGGGTAATDEIGSHENFGVEAAGLGRGFDGGHHVGLEAGGGGVADVAGAEFTAEIGDAGEDFGVVGEDFELDVGELGIHGVDIGGGGGLAFGGDPAGSDVGIVEDGPDVIPLAGAHGEAGFGLRDSDAVAAEELDEGDDGATAAEVDDGAGEIEDDGLDGVGIHG